MLPTWKKWTGGTSAERVGVSTTAGPHARTCLQMGCTEAPTHGYVTAVRCYSHRLPGMEGFDDGSHVTLHEAVGAAGRDDLTDPTAETPRDARTPRPDDLV